MRKSVVAALAVALVVVAAVAGIAAAGKPGRNDTKFQYAIGLWGDLPYSARQEVVGLPNLIADMNADEDLEFTVQDGDLKAGNGPTGNPPSVNCDDGLYQRALGWFDSLERPAIFTPGDNDWTDCDRTSNGSFDELERLQHERGVFFGTDRSLGRHPMQLEVQSTPLCLGTTSPTGSPTFETPCVENRRWTFRGVTYATLDVQGSCNNLCSSGAGDPAGDPAEYAAREAADEQWLKDTFAEADAKGSAGVMIVWQADPGFDNFGFQGGPKRDPSTLVESDGNPDGFHDVLTVLRDQTLAFGKPVVLVHGDSHYFMVDKPLHDASGQRVENFTRVETFGDNAANGTNDMNWVKVLVDPASRDVFAFEPQVVPANRVDHSVPPVVFP